MLSTAAGVSDSSVSNLTIALIALGGVLFGALLGYFGKSRELRLARQGELRNLYAEFLDAKEAHTLSTERFSEASLASDAHWEALEIDGDDDWDALPESIRKVSENLHAKKAAARTILKEDARRFQLAIRQMQIQAPNDTNKAAFIYSRLSEHDGVGHRRESYIMLIALARRDLTSSLFLWCMREVRLMKAQRAAWWRESSTAS